MAQLVPRHIGIIMDGNRRWARAHRLPALAGHKKGYDRAIEISEYAFDRGITYLTLFAFSTENWNRTKPEIQYLFRLLLQLIREQSQRLNTRGVRLKVIGTNSRLDKKIITAIQEAEELTRHNTKGTLLIAFNYGGRNEIVEAVQAVVKSADVRKSITEATIERHLKTVGIPDPDLIIRTSGEQRLSGFLLWQAAYSELYFSKKMWPEFTKKDFDGALAEFSHRARRFGK